MSESRRPLFFPGMAVAKKSDKKVDLPKLWDSIKQDMLVFEKFQTKRLEHIREYVGANYFTGCQNPDSPINLISLYVRIIISHMIGAEPRMMASTFRPERRRDCKIFEQAMNKKLGRMKFGQTLRGLLMDALFLVGIARTAITAPAEARFGDSGPQAGEVRTTIVPFENFFADSQTGNWEECEYLGHFYDVDLEDAKKSKLFNKKVRLRLVENDDSTIAESGADMDRSMTQVSTHGDRYRKKVRLCEVWLRRENIVVTFDPNNPDDPLLIQDFIGPYCGPYTFLSLLDVPGNALGKGPVMDLINLHRSSNYLWKKVDHQAAEAKRVIFYQDAETQKAVDDAMDGGGIQSTNPQGVKEVVIRTIDQSVATMAQLEEKFFSKHAGNIDTLGGLGAQADTATQEKLISKSASTLVNYMSIRFVEFAQELMKNIGWFYWFNPDETMEAEYHAPGMPEMQLTQKMTPKDRLGRDFDDIGIQLDVYSLQHQTPQSKDNVISSVMKDVFIPLLPMFGQPGVGDLLDAFVRIKATLTNTPELNELLEKIHQVQPVPQPDQSTGMQTGMPPETTRNYNRTSQPGATEQGDMQILQQLMAGGQTNQGQGMEAALRAG